MMKTVQVKVDQVGNKFVAIYRGKKTKTANLPYLRFRINHQAEKNNEIIEFTGHSGLKGSAPVIPAVPAEPKPEFNINERFQFCENIVEMVADEQAVAATFCGEGGLGKTYTVLSTLKRKGLKDLTLGQDAGDDGMYRAAKCFILVKGFSTAKALYRTLYNNRKSVVIFDDCDNIQKDTTAKNILKSALDSYASRVVCWGSELRSAEEDEDALPQSFLFEGRCIFISNMTSDELDQAIRSRAMTVDLSMTLDEKLQRMAHIVISPEFLPEIAQNFKNDALALIKEFKDKAKEINLRTLIQVAKVRASGKPNWKQMAIYLLTN